MESYRLCVAVLGVQIPHSPWGSLQYGELLRSSPWRTPTRSVPEPCGVKTFVVRD